MGVVEWGPQGVWGQRARKWQREQTQHRSARCPGAGPAPRTRSVGKGEKIFFERNGPGKKKKNLKKGAEDSEQGLPLGSWHIFLDAFPGSTVSTRLQCAGKVCATDEKEAQAL